MLTETFRFKTKDNAGIHTYKWLPENKKSMAIVQIIHGMAEHAGRYSRIAQLLTDNGYGVYANDLRGHGRNVEKEEDLGFLGENKTFDCLVLDAFELTEIIKKNHPGMPVFLLGHSLGSFISLGYIEKYGNAIKGCILSGPGYPNNLFIFVGKIIVSGEIRKHGEKYKSLKANSLTFGAYNKPFKPNRTPFDWINRDNAEVDNYINDPLCGFICTSAFFYELSKWLKIIFKRENTTQIPGTLPLFLIAGGKDSVGNMGKDIIKLYKMYKSLGIKDVTRKIYPHARHEILNELNKQVVTDDILSWLKTHVKKGSRE